MEQQRHSKVLPINPPPRSTSPQTAHSSCCTLVTFEGLWHLFFITCAGISGLIVSPSGLICPTCKCTFFEKCREPLWHWFLFASLQSYYFNCILLLVFKGFRYIFPFFSDSKKSKYISELTFIPYVHFSFLNSSIFIDAKSVQFKLFLKNVFRSLWYFFSLHIYKYVITFHWCICCYKILRKLTTNREFNVEQSKQLKWLSIFWNHMTFFFGTGFVRSFKKPYVTQNNCLKFLK